MEVRDAQYIARHWYGFASLLSARDANPKIVKSDAAHAGYLSKIMHFAPAMVSGYEVCPSRTPACTAACLHTAGHPVHMVGKEKARIGRTRMFFEQREAFKTMLFWELKCHVIYCRRHRLKAAVRLNGTSDIVWEKVMPDIFTTFPKVQFYDYSKITQRFSPEWKLPSNYKLVFSMAETIKSMTDTEKVMQWEKNVSIIFKGFGFGRFYKPLPDTYMGRKVIDGDASDLRFLDPDGVIVGLRAKGKAYKAKSKLGISLPVLQAA